MGCSSNEKSAVTTPTSKPVATAKARLITQAREEPRPTPITTPKPTPSPIPSVCLCPCPCATVTPTPAPTITPSPIVTPSPMPTAAIGKVFPINAKAFWSDDYSKGFSLSNYASDVLLPNLAAIDTKTTFNGKQTLYLRLPNGQETVPQLGVWFKDSFGNMIGRRNVWSQRVQRFDRFTTVGDGTTTGNGGVRIPSAASFKEGPFFMNPPNGQGRSGLELTNISEYVLALDSGIDPGHEHDTQARKGGANQEWNDGQFWEIISHQWIDPVDPRTAHLNMWRRPVSSSTWTVVLSTSKTLSSTATGMAWPLIYGYWENRNYNQRRVSEMGKWFAQSQLIDGSVVPDPFSLGSSPAPTVTPTPIVTPSPSITPKPTITPSPVPTVTNRSYAPILSDDFSKYADTQAFLANKSLYTFIMFPNLFSIDPSMPYKGHASLKFSQPGNMADTPELQVTPPVLLKHFWYRLKIRFSPGWTTVGNGTTWNGTKFIPSGASYKIFGYTWSDYYSRGHLLYSNTREYQVAISATTKDTNIKVMNGPIVGGFAASSEWQDGQWYEIIVHYETLPNNKSATQMYLAKDGAVQVKHEETTATMQSGYAMPQVSLFLLGMNFNQVRNPGQNQALWYGEWEIVDGSQYPNPYGLP